MRPSLTAKHHLTRTGLRCLPERLRNPNISDLLRGVLNRCSHPGAMAEGKSDMMQLLRWQAPRLLATAIVLALTLASAPGPNAAIAVAESASDIGISSSFVSPSGSHDDQLAHALRLRAEFGLSTDTATVEALESDPTASRGDLGIALSPVEAANIESRPNGTDLEALKSFGADHPRLWGGMYIDQSDGGIIDLAITAPSGVASAEVLAYVPVGIQYRVRTVTYSEASLNAVVVAVSAAMENLGKVGVDVYDVFTDIPNNRVVVDVAANPQLATDVLRADFGPSVAVAVGNAPYPTSCTSRDSCPAPWRGGLDITSVGNGYQQWCTSGYVGRKNSANFLITAGHCYGQGSLYGSFTNWYNGASCCPANKFVGNESSNSYYNHSKADAMAIAISSSAKSNYIYETSVDPSYTLTGAWGNNTVGDSVCDSVAHSNGVYCGTVISTGGSVQYDGRTFDDQTYASIDHALPGDSGGPIFSNHSLFGELTATNGANSWFSTQQDIQTELGVYPCLSLSC